MVETGNTYVGNRASEFPLFPQTSLLLNVVSFEQNESFVYQPLKGLV